MSAERAFGVAAGLDPEVATPLAARCAELGYAAIFSNDHPKAKGLETVAAFAEGSERIGLGVGVIPLDRHSPSSIAADLEATGIDPARLWLGVGAGFADRPLTKMREALPELRSALPGVRLILAAMGPRMCAFAGAEWDGAFLNWVTPNFAAEARQRVEQGAAEAGREAPPVVGYVRVAVGEDAAERLAKEEGFYRELHDGYRKHFERLDEPPGTVGVAAGSAAEAQASLADYDALDLLVVRGLASASLESMSSVAEAAAPGA